MKRNLTLAGALAAVLPLALTGLAPALADAPSARAAAPYTVIAKVNTATAIAKEDTVKVSGKVTPKAAGDRVILQQRLASKSKWGNSGTAKIKKNGKFVLTDDPSTPGTRFYRVLKPASGKVKAATSKELEVVVYRWERLASRPAGPMEGLNLGTVAIATDSFPSSISTSEVGAPGSVEYTLGRKCRTLRASYALTDASPSGATGTVTVSTDGVGRVSHPLTIGAIVRDQEISLDDVFRIKLDLTSELGAVTAIGTPEVLCTK
jgi:hypothetical protein